MEVANILNSINTILEKIFKSTEGEVFKKLDEILIIDSKILYKEPLNTLYIKAESEGLILLCSSFILFFCIYYLILRMVALYNGESVENIYRYVLRIIICVICSFSSVFICEQILNLNGLLTEIICSIGKDLTGEKICFEGLKEIILNLSDYMSEDAISVDGIIKGVISFGALTILINFSIRYVTVIFLIFVSPIVIMFASSSTTYGIFKSWTKMFAINLLVQNIVILILILPLSFKKIDNDLYKLILVGSIYLIYRINSFSKEFLGNISEQIIRRK